MVLCGTSAVEEEPLFVRVKRIVMEVEGREWWGRKEWMKEGSDRCQSQGTSADLGATTHFHCGSRSAVSTHLWVTTTHSTICHSDLLKLSVHVYAHQIMFVQHFLCKLNILQFIHLYDLSWMSLLRGIWVCVSHGKDSKDCLSHCCQIFCLHSMTKKLTPTLLWSSNMNNYFSKSRWATLITKITTVTQKQNQRAVHTPSVPSGVELSCQSVPGTSTVLRQPLLFTESVHPSRKLYKPCWYYLLSLSWRLCGFHRVHPSLFSSDSKK